MESVGAIHESPAKKVGKPDPYNIDQAKGNDTQVVPHRQRGGSL